MPWALFNVIASGLSPASVALLSLALCVRFAAALTIGADIFDVARVLGDLWLVSLRDCFGLALWVWSYAEDAVIWRGERPTLRNGLLKEESR